MIDVCETDRLWRVGQLRCRRLDVRAGQRLGDRVGVAVQRVEDSSPGVPRATLPGLQVITRINRVST